MIRQFGFTWIAIWGLLTGYGLFFSSLSVRAQGENGMRVQSGNAVHSENTMQKGNTVPAQAADKLISLKLKGETLPDALKRIEKAGGKSILFTYNGTESYRVTADIREKTEREAINIVLSKKPFICIEREEYFVVQRKRSEKGISAEGTVYDEHGAPLPYVNVLVLAPDSSFLAGSVTEEDGTFRLPPVAGEDCLLKATYVGYQPQIIPCQKENSIRLQPDAELLKEVVVTASRPMIERIDGVLTANVAGTPLSLMGSAKDMISHLPFVTGSDDEYTVLGRGTPEIYINNRKVRDITELNRLQADEILSAEIITTPGVQYGSSVGAVIRLRTIRRRGQGMSSSFYADYSQGHAPIANEGLSLNYRTGGLDIFVKTDFAEVNNYDGASITLQNIYASSEWNQSIEHTDKQTYRTFNGQVGFNYEVNQDQSFGIRYMPGTNIGYSNASSESTTLVLQDGKEVDRLHSLQRTKARTGWWQGVNGYYNGTFGKWNIDFNADYYSNRDHISQYAENNGTEDAASSNRVRNYLYAAKLLITAPLWKGKLSFGTEETFTERHDIFLQNGFSADADDRIRQTMLSGFIDYSLPLGKFNFSAGLRYEFQQTDYSEKGIHQDAQSPTYRDWIPVVSIRYTSGDWFLDLSHRTLKFNPDYAMLSSAVTYKNKYAYLSGDPFLVPQIHRGVFLTGGWKWINFNAWYHHSWDMYTSYAKPYDDIKHPGVMLLGMASVPHTNQYGGSIIFSPKIGIWQPKFTSAVEWYDSDATPIGITQHWNEPLFIFDFDNNFSLSKGWFFNIHGVLYTATKQSYAILKTKGRVDAQLTKSFFKDQSLKISLMAKDIFHTAYHNFNIYGKQTYRASRNYPDQQRIGLRLSYQFNATKSKYKGTGAGESEKSRL